MFRPGFVFTSRLALVNQSTVVQDSDLTTIAQALLQSLPQFCSAWSIQNSLVVVVPKGKAPPKGALCVYVLDTPDVEGSYGYHDMNKDTPYAKVFTKKIVQDGGAILYSTTTPLSVAQVISHEVFEMLADTVCKSWWMNSDGSIFYAAEVCDPVQGNIIPVTISGKTVGISDYVLPAWADSQAKTGPYNKLNTIKSPLTVDKHGYTIQVTGGRVFYVFGESVTQAVKEKENASLKADKRFSALRLL